jgi:hypothetical protein
VLTLLNEIPEWGARCAYFTNPVCV